MAMKWWHWMPWFPMQSWSQQVYKLSKVALLPVVLAFILGLILFCYHPYRRRQPAVVFINKQQMVQQFIVQASHQLLTHDQFKQLSTQFVSDDANRVNAIFPPASCRYSCG